MFELQAYRHITIFNAIFKDLAEKYLGSISSDHILAIALHPNYKTMSILGKPIFQNKFNDFDVIEEISKSCHKRNIKTEIIVESTPKAQSEVIQNGSDSDMDEIDLQPKQSKNSFTTIFDEYKTFRNMATTKVFENPLEILD